VKAHAADRGKRIQVNRLTNPLRALRHRIQIAAAPVFLKNPP